MRKAIEMAHFAPNGAECEYPCTSRRRSAGWKNCRSPAGTPQVFNSIRSGNKTLLPYTPQLHSASLHSLGVIHSKRLYAF
jgi:hypothetical protein